MELPRLRLHVGPQLQRIVDRVDPRSGAIGVEAKALLANMTIAERAALQDDLGFVWDQFSPDAAYVFVSVDGRLCLEFEDESSLLRWWNELDAAVAESTTRSPLE